MELTEGRATGTLQREGSMQRPHSLWCAAGSFLLKGSARERGASIHDIRTEGEGVTKSRCMEVTVDLIPNAYREKGTKIQRQFAYVCTKWTTPKARLRFSK